jgi:hypothetical protein
MSRSKPAKDTPQKSIAKAEWSTTAVHLPKTTLQLLKRVAFHRSQKDGGRMSVSKLLTDIVESHRKALEREVGE